LLETTVDKGRPTRQLAGTYIADLVALGKSIALCYSCQRKFHYKRHGYRGPVIIAGVQWVQSGCDGCREPLTRCSLFISDKVEYKL
jgi:hypothetical protein